METKLMNTNNKPIYRDTAIAVAGGTVGATVAVVSKAAVQLTASLFAVSKATVPVASYYAAYGVSTTAASGVATGFAVGAAPIVIGLNSRRSCRTHANSRRSCRTHANSRR